MIVFVYNCAKHAFIKLISFEILFEYISNFNFKFDFVQQNISTTKQKFQNLFDKRKKLQKKLKHNNETQTK